MDTVSIFGIPVAKVTEVEAIEWIVERAKGEGPREKGQGPREK